VSKTTLIGVAVTLLSISAVAQSNVDMRTIVQDKLMDLSADVAQQTANRRELERISRDFANAYRISQLSIQYREPLMMRLDSRVGVVPVRFIINGNRRRMQAGPVRDTEDITNAPGKRNSLFDLGIITPAFAKLIELRFLRTEGNTPVYEMTWASGRDTSKHVIWFDTRTRLITKRQWYAQSGFLRATFEYKNPVEVQPGIWVPSSAEAYNAQGRLGGTTRYTRVRVNEGIPASEFAF